MTEPIINPWIFYWVECLGSITCLLCLTVSFLGVFVLWRLLAYTIDGKKLPHNYCFLLTTFIVCSLLLCFIPSKDTMYKMWMASYVTPQNLEYVGNAADNLLDNIEKRIDRYINGAKND